MIIDCRTGASAYMQSSRDADGQISALNRNESMNMNRQSYERVHLWACTQVVVVTNWSLWLDKREA